LDYLTLEMFVNNMEPNISTPQIIIMFTLLFLCVYFRKSYNLTKTLKDNMNVMKFNGKKHFKKHLEETSLKDTYN
jgi:hypothetical protein